MKQPHGVPIRKPGLYRLVVTEAELAELFTLTAVRDTVARDGLNDAAKGAEFVEE